MVKGVRKSWDNRYTTQNVEHNYVYAVSIEQLDDRTNTTACKKVSMIAH